MEVLLIVTRLLNGEPFGAPAAWVMPSMQACEKEVARLQKRDGDIATFACVKRRVKATA
jgi:hypothetical protein